MISSQVRSGQVSGMLYLLQATIREVDEVLALGDVAVPGLCEAVVVLGVIIQNPGEWRDIKINIHHLTDTLTSM